MRLFRRPGGFGGALDDLQGRIGVKIEGGLLETALTHSSYANENPAAGVSDNERLEFLGDAVLQFCAGALLYRRFPRADAGKLTRLRASLVSEEALHRLARQLELGRHLRLGRGEDLSGGRERRSLLADAFEAVVGAVYLSAGVREAESFVARQLAPLLDAIPGGAPVDAKTALQELAQARGARVGYRVVDEMGPDHSKNYTVEARIGGTVLGRGVGRSKKEAEQAAATQALERMGPDDVGRAGNNGLDSERLPR